MTSETEHFKLSLIWSFVHSHAQDVQEKVLNHFFLWPGILFLLLSVSLLKASKITAHCKAPTVGNNTAGFSRTLGANWGEMKHK